MKIKKILAFSLMTLGLFTVASCKNEVKNVDDDSSNENSQNEGNNENQGGNQEPEVIVVSDLLTPNVIILNNVISWDTVANAKGYVVKINDVEYPEQTETTYTLPEIGTYNVSVKAVSSDTKKYNDSSYSEVKTYSHVLETTTLWVLGDSTSCSFENDKSDQVKYYPRYGYGTQLSNYFIDKVNVNNIAVSGRSTGSYFTESSSKLKYEQYTSNVKEGDYVLIAFGHNDQNTDERYSNANLSSTDTTKKIWTDLDSSKYDDGKVEREISLKYLLTHYYIDVATENGATPILATPIVRRNNSDNTLSDSQCHIWAGQGEYVGGDYAKCIRDLAAEKNITLVDNTAITKQKYEAIGKDSTLKMHAWTSSNPATVDNTHLNIYGAKWVAYKVAEAISNSNCELKYYVKDDNVEPTEKNDLVVNPSYVESEYEAPTAGMNIYNTTSPWKASAFGALGGNPSTSTHKVTEASSKVTLQVTGNKGKIAANSDGILMYYQQLDAESNFTLTATMTVTQFENNTQVGFGIMIRDDMYVNVNSANNAAIGSNYVACGSAVANATQQASSAMRKDTALTKGTATSIALNTSVTLKIVKNGDTYTVTYGSMSPVTYTVDLTEIDSQYVYAGLYVARNATVEFTNFSIV